MTTKFRTRLVADIDGGLPYTLQAMLIYDSARLGKTLFIPIGFQTDLASVPRILWNILPPFGRYSDAAVVHDWLYQKGGCSRVDADAVLLEGMAVCGVGWVTRWTIYTGVRVGGGSIWAKYRANDTAVR